jgi:hypothetical protein
MVVRRVDTAITETRIPRRPCNRAGGSNRNNATVRLAARNGNAADVLENFSDGSQEAGIISLAQISGIAELSTQAPRHSAVP